MRVQFHWQAMDEEGRWEVVATQGSRARIRPTRWIVRLCVVSLAFCLGVGSAVSLRLYHDALRRMTFQIQCTADLEARAYAGHHTTLLLALQDPAPSAWYDRQARCAVLRQEYAAAGLEGQLDTDRACLPVEAGTVQRVDLRGDVAQVELVTDPGQRRVVRFYRQTERGWVHTVPTEAFWGGPVQVDGEDVVVHGTQRDLHHLQRVHDTVVVLRRELCSELVCGEAPLVVQVVTQTLGWPEVSPSQIALLSPSLAGVLRDGALSEPYRDELGFRTAYVLVSQWVGADSGGWTNLLQRSIVEQVAAYGRGGIEETPVLSRIVARDGADVVPAVIASVRGMDDLAQFLSRWFGVLPDDAEDNATLLVEMMRAPALSSYEATAQLFVTALNQGDLVDERSEMAR